MPFFRKKPVTIEAVQWDGSIPSIDKVRAFCPAAKCHATVTLTLVKGEALFVPMFCIPTLEGQRWAQVGDWIIKGVNGEFYPCKPDIFAKTYEPMETA